MTIDELSLKLDSIFGLAEMDESEYAEAMQTLKEYILKQASMSVAVKLEPLNEVINAIRNLKNNSDYIKLRGIINDYNSQRK